MAQAMNANTLYYIVSLHQTTTNITAFKNLTSLYYIVSLHQTTTIGTLSLQINSCIISFLYIKPQQSITYLWNAAVVLYRFSTSNHNLYHLHY